MGEVRDFTLEHVRRQRLALLELLDAAQYPRTESAGAVLVNTGVRLLQELGVSNAEILQLVMMFFNDPLVAVSSNEEKSGE